jgi:hypothetical protein
MATKATSRPEGGTRLVRNPDEELENRTLGRDYPLSHLIRVNQAARRSRQARFPALLHHVDVEALERAFRRLRRKAPPEVDGVTVDTYEGKLSDNLQAAINRFLYEHNTPPSSSAGPQIPPPSSPLSNEGTKRWIRSTSSPTTKKRRFCAAALKCRRP